MKIEQETMDFEAKRVILQHGTLDPSSRPSDPDTSHAAALDAGKFASKNRILALKTLTIHPMTDFELAEKTGLQQNSIGKRRGECFQVGMVEKLTDLVDGHVVKRPAPSGSSAIVWRITAKGIRFLKENE